jgi:hypothetical protein
MNWLKSRTNSKALERPYASAQEIRAVFEELNQALNWTAVIITGESSLATHSVVNAGELAETNNYVFREWLVRWAHTATARSAIQNVSESIRSAAQRYPTTCSHSTHPLLSSEEVSQLHLISPDEIVESLDPLARAVLVLHGCQHATLADCALLLRVPGKCILPAYCAALQWHRQRTKMAARAAEGQNPPLEPSIHTEPDSSLIRRKDSFDVVRSK